MAHYLPPFPRDDPLPKIRFWIAPNWKGRFRLLPKVAHIIFLCYHCQTKNGGFAPEEQEKNKEKFIDNLQNLYFNNKKNLLGKGGEIMGMAQTPLSLV